ncbi:hypothetical protein [Rhizobium leguminosarum]|uniref:hypothetical protein n=1 Tax=Rhizobium leguminosarum TaxID=384 RepID=UPI000B92AB67|nr:hypothetical protein [Rhizobium leguminosarum]ASS56903.1 hypothetical protein CHR56_21400 [Rhizobium leguminosarum bv. viciae]
MDTHDIITYAGVFFGGIVIALVGYLRKKPSPPAVGDATLAGIGIELGNRVQVDALIEEVRRCADSLEVLADRKQAGFEAKLDRLIEDLEEKEKAEWRRR